MEPIESSETSAYINTLTPGTYPKEKKLQYITAFTWSRHLSQINPVHAPHTTSWRSILSILPSTPGFSRWSLFLRFPHKSPLSTSSLPHTCYVPHQFHSYRFDHPNNVWWGIRSHWDRNVGWGVFENRVLTRIFGDKRDEVAGEWS